EAVLREMAARGATIMALAERDAEVVFSSGVPELLRNVLYLPVGQMLGYERSLWRGLNPDRPNNLEAVVRLDPN
ncbi:MAG: SIS domain-containing protein, partial [Anaerolineae bacterium]